VQEGVRFAFSTELEQSTEHVPLGSHLVFLSILCEQVSDHSAMAYCELAPSSNFMLTSVTEAAS
jgi:hypothetical protein